MDNALDLQSGRLGSSPTCSTFIINFHIMGNIILGCILANLILLAIAGVVLYFIYKKNETSISNTKNKIKLIVEEAEHTFSEVNNTVEELKKLIDKLPFG